MTNEQLNLLAEGLTRLTTSAAPTQDEVNALVPLMAKVKAAKAQTAMTGKPIPLDLSGYAGLFNKMTTQEDQTAKSNMLDIVLNQANAHTKLARDPEAADQFKLTTASQLSKILGKPIDPNTIQVDKKNGVVVPEIQKYMDAAKQTPNLVKSAYSDLNSTDPAKVSKARAFLQHYGVSPDSSPNEATRTIRNRIKVMAFE